MPPRITLPVIAVGVFLAANVVIPAIWGDLYPFTSAPMFRDSPRQYCDYRVFDPHGAELAREDWMLQRIYDGNPVGYGTGIRPPEVLEREFGIVHSEEEVRRHVSKRFAALGERAPDVVTVEQSVYGVSSSGRVGLLSTSTWKITRPAA